MSYLSVVKNPKNFGKAFFNEVQNQPVSASHQGIFNVLLYYIWRGSFDSATKAMKFEGDIDLLRLCLSTYKAFLPVLQLIRMGYAADAFVLMRTLMERIAILGYLSENQDLLDEFKRGKSHFQKKAMMWAKTNSLPNWMKLHSFLTNIAHSKLEGAAGHIYDENIIGQSFRYLIPLSNKQVSVTDEVLALVWYAITAVTPYAEKALSISEYSIYPNDRSISKYVEKADLTNFENFINIFAFNYKNLK
jgi:hypothetical protein